MWNTFWADVIVAVVGAILTAFIAVGTALWTYRREKHRREVAAVEQLIYEMNTRRVMADTLPIRIEDARSKPDFQRCEWSMLYLRDEARATRREVRENTTVVNALTDLVATYNQYLEDSEADPDGYRQHLMAARAESIEWGKVILAALPGVPEVDPGSRSLARNV